VYELRLKQLKLYFAEKVYVWRNTVRLQAKCNCLTFNYPFAYVCCVNIKHFWNWYM